ncbi:hypothetical protein [Desulfotruncus alcoholivorax]|uniref:hypothetical protein n=1 Tax=Desulfotruncus alcoholivorax TaxID=265477 RepID=UPI0003FF19ED|nr:hypothetical protein [Desulfotruncus alcoholivorax]
MGLEHRWGCGGRRPLPGCGAEPCGPKERHARTREGEAGGPGRSIFSGRPGTLPDRSADE